MSWYPRTKTNLKFKLKKKYLIDYCYKRLCNGEEWKIYKVKVKEYWVDVDRFSVDIYYKFNGTKLKEYIGVETQDITDLLWTQEWDEKQASKNWSRFRKWVYRTLNSRFYYYWKFGKFIRRIKRKIGLL